MGCVSKSLEELFLLREATDADKGWILQLAEELAEVTVPPLRGVWGEQARLFARTSISNLFPYSKSGVIRFLVATDRQTEERVGYLILNMHHEGPFEERETYIEDMGVVSDYLGKRVGHFLTDQAAKISAEAGVDYLGAHVSFANRRALLTAMGNGFELESYRIVRPCTERAQQATKESETALERQEQNEKMRRTLLSRRIKRRQRRNSRASKRDS
jgi:ribosomal protein S18 acetylase RimI-like enzyme